MSTILLGGDLNLAASGLTYRAGRFPGRRRHASVATGSPRYAPVRISASATIIVEYGWNMQYDQLEAGYVKGSALYGNLNLYHGPLSVSWETSDYERFEVVPRADGPLGSPSTARRPWPGSSPGHCSTVLPTS